MPGLVLGPRLLAALAAGDSSGGGRGDDAGEDSLAGCETQGGRGDDGAMGVMVEVAGSAGCPAWSPDNSVLGFVSRRASAHACSTAQIDRCGQGRNTKKGAYRAGVDQRASKAPAKGHICGTKTETIYVSHMDVQHRCACSCAILCRRRDHCNDSGLIRVCLISPNTIARLEYLGRVA